LHAALLPAQISDSIVGHQNIYMIPQIPFFLNAYELIRINRVLNRFSGGGILLVFLQMGVQMQHLMMDNEGAG
jgi:hypothetical protein